MSDDLVSNAWSLTVEVDRLNVALTEARAEIERLTEQARRDREYSASQAGQHAKLVNRTLAAESELSTLRARVREVVGPFAALEATGWTGSYLSEPGHDGSDVSVLHHAASNITVTRGHFRAARQLMEDLK